MFSLTSDLMEPCAAYGCFRAGIFEGSITWVVHIMADSCKHERKLLQLGHAREALRKRDHAVDSVAHIRYMVEIVIRHLMHHARYLQASFTTDQSENSGTIALLPTMSGPEHSKAHPMILWMRDVGAVHHASAGKFRASQCTEENKVSNQKGRTHPGDEGPEGLQTHERPAPCLLPAPG